MRQRKAKNLVERMAVFAYDEMILPDECKGSWQNLFVRKQPLFLELGCGKGQFIIEMASKHPENNYIAVEGQCTVILRALEKAHGIEPKAMSDMSEYGSETDSQTDAEAGSEAGSETDSQTGSETDSQTDPQTDAEADPQTDAEADPQADSEEDIQDAVYRGTDNLVFVNTFMRGLDKYFEKGELDGIFLNFSDPWPKVRHAKRRLTHAGFLKSYKRILKPGSQIQFKSDNDGLFDFSVKEFRNNGFEIVEFSTDLHNDQTHYESADVPTEYEEKFIQKGKNINYCKSIYKIN